MMEKKATKPTREWVWANAWAHIAAADTCPDAKIASSWADACLREFDARFPQGKECAS